MNATDEPVRPRPPAGRRLAAIAFVDIVGYSILMARQEAKTLARWRALLGEIIHPELARHHGTYVKSTGDGLLAEFPSALDAVTWALAVQRAVSRDPAPEASGAPPPPITLRIAVHVGDVMPDAGGDIFGDGVNVAARLQEFAEPGGIALSEAVHDLVRGHLDHPARDLGPLSLKNLDRPVRAFLIEPAVPGLAVPAMPGQHSLPSIAVLPLQNLSGDPGEDYFCEGIVEDIVTSLAGLRELFVISRNSTLGLARVNADLREIGRALGVRYVLTGSVRRSSKRVRVAVQLADATTSAHVWARSFDFPFTDLFEQQDRIVEGIVAGIAPNIRTHELRRAMRKRPESYTAYDLTLQGINLILRLDRETFPAAKPLFDRAIKEDPLFTLPRIWAAQWHSINVGQGWSTDAGVDTQAAIDLAHRAVVLDGDNATALAVHAHMCAYHSHDYETALAEFERALASSSNSALAWCLSAPTLSYVGRAEEAIRNVRRGLQLSPYDPGLCYFYHFGGIAHYALGACEDALKWVRMSATENPRYTSNLRIMAAVQQALGLHDAARHTVQTLLSIEPDFSLGKYLRTRQPFRAPAIKERYIVDLEGLGLPA